MKIDKEIKILEEVTALFKQWLENHKGRKTPERFAVLNEIYSRQDHVDAETLFNDLKRKKLNISRATVYNTLDLLVESNLVTKHQFQNSFAQFEKSYGSKQHDHLICIECKDVLEFCDPRIQQITSKMGEILNFKVEAHSLIIYGHCLGCDKVQSPLKAKK